MTHIQQEGSYFSLAVGNITLLTVLSLTEGSLKTETAKRNSGERFRCWGAGGREVETSIFLSVTAIATCTLSNNGNKTPTGTRSATKGKQIPRVHICLRVPAYERVKLSNVSPLSHSRPWLWKSFSRPRGGAGSREIKKKKKRRRRKGKKKMRLAKLLPLYYALWSRAEVHFAR